jgi:hypothetical protein
MISWQPPMIRVARHRFRTSCPQESSISLASQIIRPCVLTDSLTSVEQPWGDVLLEQWIEGYASALFIFGTACLIAAACTVLFAIIAVIGLVTSRVYSDES